VAPSRQVTATLAVARAVARMALVSAVNSRPNPTVTSSDGARSCWVVDPIIVAAPWSRITFGGTVQSCPWPSLASPHTTHACTRSPLTSPRAVEVQTPTSDLHTAIAYWVKGRSTGDSRHPPATVECPPHLGAGVFRRSQPGRIGAATVSGPHRGDATGHGCRKGLAVARAILTPGPGVENTAPGPTPWRRAAASGRIPGSAGTDFTPPAAGARLSTDAGLGPDSGRRSVLLWALERRSLAARAQILARSGGDLWPLERRSLAARAQILGRSSGGSAQDGESEQKDVHHDDHRSDQRRDDRGGRSVDQ
jgi:hypothetical protein